MKKIVGLMFALSLTGPVSAEQTYLGGSITNVTSHSGGLLIMLSSGVPTNCTGTPYGWMLIPEVNKTMVALALMTYAQGKGAVVYTDSNGGSGICVINQFDPN